MKKFAFMIVLPALLSFGLVIPNENTDEKESMTLDIPSINKTGNGVDKAALEKMKAQLTASYKSQINIFSKESLTIFDDNEMAVKVDLTIPDFNLVNVFSDLNKVVTFKFYLKNSGDKFRILEMNNKKALKESDFDTKRHTYIIMHGWVASSDSPLISLIRKALQKTTDSNVITVNWSHLAKGPYSVARLFVSRVGEHISKYVNFLYENGMNSKATTLIGHSLGAHIMGIAGQNLQKKVNHTIGLDPAWPLFVSTAANNRLSPDDALHVEVIHTNAGLLGYPFNLGHYDFYPNGGTLQEGCKVELMACSHQRSCEYLAEQISNPGREFCSLKCKSYSEFAKNTCTKEIAIMGGISSYPANEGTYYLKTNSKEPFSLPTKCV